ncbi:tRNA 2-thiouridine(34) synthase MnmA [Myxococcota bacterium]|nr:tRNA 2-thiouridine(34) synthase MnmA [Myxococcota bacterium]
MALSGGVDSAVAAALLREAGCEVVGVTLKLWDYPPEVEGGCCSATDIGDARRLASDLGFSHYVLDERERFEASVVAPFVRAYLGGTTPSPCVACNQGVKFGRLLRLARDLGADRLVTGHYARLGIGDDDGSVLLRRAADRARDQSYFLYGLGPADLTRLWFPLGEMTKARVREEGRRLGVRVADKPDSQDLCFLPSGDPRAFVEARAGGAVKPGEVVDREGRVLGRHGGVHRFTVGQRRGLGLPSPTRLYVVAVDAGTGRVTVGGEEELASGGLVAGDFRWARVPGPGEALAAQVRARAPEAPARAELLPDGRVRVRFLVPQRAIAPGQAVVLYSADEVVGGGTIQERVGVCD